ncbi:MAG TPA: chemotaxis-specific protein-glutamate methyltransferase CheB [Telluria sp.]|jgi:two-component system response regulator WspF
MKIGIANDVAMAAEALRRVIAGTSEHQVVWIARTGLEAVRMCADQRPDLVLMDLNMPELDGVEATRQIMERSPCAILIVTGAPQDNVSQVFRALGAGALDVTATPILAGAIGGDSALLAKIKTIGKLVKASRSETRPPRAEPEAGTGVRHLLAIGASTGGPVAVAHILSNWTPPAGTAIVVVQHIDENFGAHFARWLGEHTAVPVRVIEDGDALTADCVQIARTNDHLTLNARQRLHYAAEPRDYPYRPSVDVFFECVARHWAGDATGVLLTGMGRDGAQGLLAMRQAGKATIAQDQASSAVYGMPRAAADIGAAQQILSLEQIARTLRHRGGAKLS